MPANQSSASTTATPRDLKLAATAGVWWLIVGALVELVVLQVRRRAHPMMPIGNDFVWMAPLGLFFAAAVGMVPGVVLGTVRPRLGSRLLLLGVATPVVLNVLLLIPRMSPYAAALLALGISVQWMRVAHQPASWLRTLVRRTTPAVAVLAAAAAAWIWFASPAPSAPAIQSQSAAARPLNVVLITLDTVRAASLGLYAPELATSPRLNAFAARGVTFERAFSTAPWTLPSHASLFTGRWPHELSADFDKPLDGAQPTLAEFLSNRGYATAGFVANLGYCGYGTGLGRGFSHYEDFQRSAGEVAATSTLLRTVGDNFRLRRLVQNSQHLNRIDADDLNRRVLSWLSDHEDQPSFVFINYFDAHEPYLPPPPFDRQFGSGRQRGEHSPLHDWLWDPSVGHRPLSAADLREEQVAYQGAIAYLDDRLGRLFDEMEQRRLLSRTLVIVTADHGEELGEHGVFDHGYSLYRPALQVPLIVVAPEAVPAGTRVRTAVSLRGVPATIADLLGFADGAPFQGRSLSEHWAATPPPAAPVFSEVRAARGQPDWFPASKGDMASVIVDGTHCIRAGDGTLELYDIETDMWEQTNLAARVEFEPRLTKCRALLDGPWSRPSVPAAEN